MAEMAERNPRERADGDGPRTARPLLEPKIKANGGGHPVRV